jgi:hypothetical protein
LEAKGLEARKSGGEEARRLGVEEARRLVEAKKLGC